MEGSGCMRRVCESYILHVKAIGALYCAVPAAAWFGFVIASAPYRQVYALRLVLSLIAGCWIGAQLNRFGLSLWLTKHRSQDGPGTILDGALIGAAIGIGTALLPPLTSLISTNHPELAKTFIIASWFGAAAAGAVIGGSLAAIGRRHIERTPSGQGGQ